MSFTKKADLFQCISPFLLFLFLLYINVSYTQGVKLHEVFLSTVEEDFKYFEVSGTPQTNLSACTLVEIDPSGKVQYLVEFTGQIMPNDGVWVAANPKAVSLLNLDPDLILDESAFNTENATYLLLDKFNGHLGEDLDGDDDGILDSRPWEKLVDQIAITSSSSDFTYAEPSFRPEQGRSPVGAYRCPNNLNLWLPLFFEAGTPLSTAGTINLEVAECAPASVPVQLNEIVISSNDGNEPEYFEVVGTPGLDLGACTLIDVDAEGKVGFVIEFANQFVPTDGVWLGASLAAQKAFSINANLTIPDELFTNETRTYLLVDKFSGQVGVDLDTDDNGVLDIEPWSKVVDEIAFRGTATGFTYSESLIAAEGVGVAAGALRCLDDPAKWGAHSSTGVLEEATPGRVNADICEDEVIVAQPVRLNEIIVNSLGAKKEYFEVTGTPGTNLAACTLVEIDENGVVGDLIAFTDQFVPEDGVWVAASNIAKNKFGIEPNKIIGDKIFDNKTCSYLLLDKFEGVTGDDLDTNDDGILDSEPWGKLVDQIAFRGRANGYTYATPVLNINSNIVPAGALRCPEDPDTWQIHDYEKIDVEATPGEVNIVTESCGPGTTTVAIPTSVKLNEMVVYTENGDREYFEVVGTPGTNLSACTLVEINSKGIVGNLIAFTDQIVPDDGIWVAATVRAQNKFNFVPDLGLVGNNIFRNRTSTYLLLDKFEGESGDDLDADNDGVLDGEPWARLVDQIAFRIDAVGYTYSDLVINLSNEVMPAGAFKCPNDEESWVAYNSETVLTKRTPGLKNVASNDCQSGATITSPVRLNEIMVHTLGSETEYFEVSGTPGVNLSACTLIEINRTGEVAKVIGFADQVVPEDGIWVAASSITNNKYGINPDRTIGDRIFNNNTNTYLLIDKFIGQQGDDLDTNNDGVLDLRPWSRIVDQIAFRGNDIGHTYSHVVFGIESGIAPAGALRCPNDPSTWEIYNYENAFLKGTPGTVNIEVESCSPALAQEVVSIPVRLNEMIVRSPEREFEYFEVSGPPGANLSACTLVEISGSGKVLEIVEFADQFVPENGIWLAASPAAQEELGIVPDKEIPNGIFRNKTTSYLLLDKFTGSIGDDLDGDDDGELDGESWTRLVDQIAFKGNSQDHTYATPVFDRNGNQIPFGAFRCPGSPDNWVIYRKQQVVNNNSPGVRNANIGDCKALENQVLFDFVELEEQAEWEETADIVLYPNPVSSQVHIDFQSPELGRLKVVVRDIQGSIIQEQMEDKDDQQTSIVLKVNHLSSGIYIIQIQLGENIYNGRFVKIDN